jgi:cytidylate kinase
MERSRRTNIERLVDRRISNWHTQRRAEEEQRRLSDVRGHEAIYPYVAVSRQVASGGNEFAAALAARLGYTLFDREIVDYIAERANVRVAAVKSLGETWFNAVHDWISGVIDTRFLAADEYARHLVAVVGTVARHESAVFVGRGVGHFLPPERGLRVRVVASLERRVAYAEENYGMSRAAARELIMRSDASRVGFTRAYFNADISDPLHYDITFNLDRCPSEEAIEACVSLLSAIVGEPVGVPAER